MPREIRLRRPRHRPHRSHLPRIKFSLRIMMAVLVHVCVLIGGWLIAARYGVPEAKTQLADRGVGGEFRVIFPFVVRARYYDFDPITGDGARVRAYFLVLPWETRLMGYALDVPDEAEKPWETREEPAA